MSFTVPNKRGCSQKTREVHVEDARPRQPHLHQHEHHHHERHHYMGHQDRHRQLRPQHARFGFSQGGLFGQSPTCSAVQQSRFQVRPLDLGGGGKNIVGGRLYGGSVSAASSDVDSLSSPVRTDSSGPDLDDEDMVASLLPMEEVRVEPSRKVSETLETLCR